MRTLLLTPLLRNCFVGSFSIGVALGAGIVHGISEASFYDGSTTITRTGYERIALQMSLTQVEVILGKGAEVAQSESVIAFEWKNPDGSSITIFFKEDRMIQKSQTGL